MTDTARAGWWMAGAVASFSALAIAARIVLGDLTTLQLMFYRNVIAVSILLAFLPMIGLRRLRSHQPFVHLIRHTVHFAGQYAWFLAIALIPLAQVFALEFTAPIWAMLFAALLLGEQITARRVLAVVLGFAGMLLVVRPGMVALEVGSLIMLAGAMAYGVAHTLTRKITRTDSPVTVMVYMVLVQLPLTAIAFVLDPIWPPAWQWPCLVSIGLTALTSHYCLARALALAPATVVMPMDFLRLPLIALLAWLIFQEAVELWVLAGGVVMFVGIWVNLRSPGRSVSPQQNTV